MRKILSFVLLFITLSSFAQETKKTWSFYGNVGIGFNSKVTLEGLRIPEEDMQYFKSRGLTPNILTSAGSTSAVPAFMLGASYYFMDMFRASLELGSQYVNQSNFHARNFTMDAMFGYTFSPIGENHEFNVDLGLGYYALRNNYVYSWKGVDSKGNQLYNNGIPEQRTIYLGNHDVNTLTIPLKLSYLYNFYGRNWIGVYAQGRVNMASDAFCPRVAASVGIEYRFTLGRTRKKSEPKVITRTQYVYVEKNNYMFISRPEEPKRLEAPRKNRTITQDILFELNSSELTETSLSVLHGLEFEGVSKIEITASTCSRGTVHKNDELAAERLEVVTQCLRDLGYTGEIVGKTSHSQSPDPDWRSAFIKLFRD